MNAIFKKLNLKDHTPVYVINPPESFNKEMDEIKAMVEVKTTLSKAAVVPFMLAFVTTQNEVDTLTKAAVPLLKDDGLLWFAYPKGSSKKYKCEFNRDSGWSELGRHGFEGVRMVAIDEDWSALRFRRAEYIKTMTRSFAMSEEGMAKVSAKRAEKKKK